MSTADSSLGALQAWMQQALIFPARAPAHTTEEHILASSRLSAAGRLGIYQRSYYARILKCMLGQFPALCYALGEALFSDFAHEYLQAYPSTAYTLYALGSRFPAYLRAQRPDREKPEAEREDWIDFMVDLAHFERQLFVLFDAPGHEGKPFAQPDTPDARLRLQPCFALHEYRYPVAWYYYQVRQEKEPDFPPRQVSYVAMLRRNYLTRTFPLTRAHFRFLTTMAQGGSVAEALTTVARAAGQPLEEVARAWHAPEGTRSLWLGAGMFIDAAR